MRKDVHFTLLWKNADYIEKKYLYGVVFGSYKFIGIKVKIPEKDLTKRHKLAKEWLERIKKP